MSDPDYEAPPKVTDLSPDRLDTLDAAWRAAEGGALVPSVVPRWLVNYIDAFDIPTTRGLIARARQAAELEALVRELARGDRPLTGEQLMLYQEVTGR